MFQSDFISDPEERLNLFTPKSADELTFREKVRQRLLNPREVEIKSYGLLPYNNDFAQIMLDRLNTNLPVCVEFRGRHDENDPEAVIRSTAFTLLIHSLNMDFNILVERLKNAAGKAETQQDDRALKKEKMRHLILSPVGGPHTGLPCYPTIDFHPDDDISQVTLFPIRGEDPPPEDCFVRNRAQYEPIRHQREPNPHRVERKQAFESLMSTFKDDMDVVMERLREE